MVDRTGLKTLREVIEIERVTQQHKFTIEQFAKWADAAIARAFAWNISIEQRGWVYKTDSNSWAFNFDNINSQSDKYQSYDRAMKGI